MGGRKEEGTLRICVRLGDGPRRWLAHEMGGWGRELLPPQLFQHRCGMRLREFLKPFD